MSNSPKVEKLILELGAMAAKMDYYKKLAYAFAERLEELEEVEQHSQGYWYWTTTGMEVI